MTEMEGKQFTHTIISDVLNYLTFYQFYMYYLFFFRFLCFFFLCVCARFVYTYCTNLFIDQENDKQK